MSFNLFHIVAIIKKKGYIFGLSLVQINMFSLFCIELVNYKFSDTSTDNYFTIELFGKIFTIYDRSIRK